MMEGNKSDRRNKGNKGYHALIVWQRANEFVLLVYKTSKLFPREEIFGLTSQIRRASVSIASNIVEGHAKKSQKDFLRYLDIAKGSLTECEYYLELLLQLDFLNKEQYNALEDKRSEVGYLLFQFCNAIK